MPLPVQAMLASQIRLCDYANWNRSKNALTGRFLQRKLEEYEALKKEIELLRTNANQTEKMLALIDKENAYK